MAAVAFRAEREVPAFMKASAKCETGLVYAIGRDSERELEVWYKYVV